MSQSKSVMMAVHSGQSFSEARKTPRKSKPVNEERSPLKNHEQSNTTENQDDEQWHRVDTKEQSIDKSQIQQRDCAKPLFEQLYIDSWAYLCQKTNHETVLKY